MYNFFTQSPIEVVCLIMLIPIIGIVIDIKINK